MSSTDHKRRYPNEDSAHGPVKDHRRHPNQQVPFRRSGQQQNDGTRRSQHGHQDFAKEQTRLNQIQEAEQMREWVSKEDQFVLKQSKKKAQIRVREGRARLIDWLTITLSALEDDADSLEDDSEDEEVEIIDPAAVFEGLGLSQLQDVMKDVETYYHLETRAKNRKYWGALKAIGEDRQRRLDPNSVQNHGRSSKSIAADVDRLLSPKKLAELETLEKQIKTKLRSNEPIDVEYWENLLQDVGVYKSKAELSAMYQSIIEDRLKRLRKEECEEAASAQEDLKAILSERGLSMKVVQVPVASDAQQLDPQPMLRLRAEDKAYEVEDEKDFLARTTSEWQRVKKMGYVPLKRSQISNEKPSNHARSQASFAPEITRFAPPSGEDFSSATTALYEREVARGVQENEEIFAGEEEVVTKSKSQWAGKHRPRKPRYFNRVQMGYEWNKYNQTHYDHDNPPPKVVQGYKFNIFYPDLIDKTRAPTYRIEREDGRKRGETSAPAGEEDTCLIRFVSGPPYEDIAFRILDKKWDLSAQRERGFKSSFEKGILQLHFQFKKVFYRK